MFELFSNRTPWTQPPGRLRLNAIRKALPAELAAMVAEHFATADAPLKVIGRRSEAALRHLRLAAE